MKLIIGLGNPGKKYERTRHNIGFLVVDGLVNRTANKWTEGKGPFQINRDPFESSEAILAKPTLFMNESGSAVKALLEQHQVPSEQCLVVVDDVNLPLGNIRFRLRGSAGGHHGLESIIGVLGTRNFPRLRIGVGNSNLSGQDLTQYVLGRFSREEWDFLLPQIERAGDACLEWVKKGAVHIAEPSQD